MSVARSHLKIQADRDDTGYDALRLLREASDRIAAGRALEAVLPDILATATALTAATGAAVLWCRDERFQLTCFPRIEPAAEPLLLQFLKSNLGQSGPVQSDGREVREVVRATASLCVPLRARQEVVGTLAVFTDREQAFDTCREHLLALLATFIAQAIDGEALATKAHRRGLTLAGLRRVNQDVAAHRDSQALLKEIADISLEVLGTDFVVLYEYLEEEKDVRIPPIHSGPLRSADILERRGAVISHRESVVFKLLDEKKAIYAPDALNDWQRRGLAQAAQGKESFLVREGVISSAGVPLVFDNKAMGVLFVNYRTPQSFDQEQQEQIELFSSQAALTIALARHLENSRRHTTSLATLTEVGTRLSYAVGLAIERILDLVYEEAVKLLRAKNLYILFYSEESKSYAIPFRMGVQEPLDKLSATELQKTLANYVIRTRRPCLVDTERYHRLIAQGKIVPVELLGLIPAKIWLGAPMIARGKVLGMIAVQDYENQDSYDQDDLNLLTTLASQAAIAIDNARLLQTVQTQKTSEEILARFQDLRLALADLLRQMVRALDSEGGVIFLRDQEPDKIRVAVTYKWSELENRRLTLEQGLAGKVAATREPLVENDYTNWPEKAPFFSRDENRQKIGSAIGVPIVAHGELLGVVTVTSRPEKRRRYIDTDVERLMGFVGPDGPVVAAVDLARKISFQKALIDNSPYPVIGSNTSGLLTTFNAAAARLTGYQRKEILDQGVTKLYWNGPLEVVRIYRRLQEEGGNIQIETAIRTKRGEKIPVLLSAAFLTDEQGSVLGSMAVLEDLRLGSLRGKNRDLIAAIDQIDRSPHKMNDLVDTLVGEAMKLFEADAGCLFVTSGAQFKARSNLHSPDRSLQELVLSKSSPIIQETLRSRVSSLLPALSSKGEVFLLPEGRKSGLLIPMADDTDVHGFLLLESKRDKNHFRFEREFIRVFAARCAQALRRARLEEALMRTGGTLAAAQVGTIHEIKNALSNLFWTVRDIKQATRMKQIAIKLQIVDAEIERLTELTERLRKVSNNLEPRKTYECLNDIVLSAAEVLGSSIRSQGVTLDLDLDSNLDGPEEHRDARLVLVDKVQISQVITNLALNALEASQEGGKILFQTRLRKQMAELRIADTGRGLTSAQLRNLFKPYLTAKPRGSGLGLAISKLIVENNHSGKISVRSKLGRGTTVSVLLPIVRRR